MNASEKRVEKLEAKIERLEGTNTRLKGAIADLKARRAANRSAKAKVGASARSARTAPKGRKSTRRSQPAAAAA
jgi:chromosome segregation ATPase